MQTAGTARDELLAAVRLLAKGEAPFDLVKWRRRLEQLKQAYIARYSELHTQEVLGPADDDRRKRLQQDPRAQQLSKSLQIEILNAQELRRWEELVKGMPASRELHAGLLEATPTYRGFRPSRTIGGTTAARRLDIFTEQLDHAEAMACCNSAKPTIGDD